MDAFEAALELMPLKYSAEIRSRKAFLPEELRLRVGQAPSLLYHGEEHPLGGGKVTEDDLVRVLEKATGASLYSAAEAMRQGYFCVGTLRIGICGRANTGGSGTGFSSYSSLCIRLAREYRGICADIAERLCTPRFENTLILAPPGGGKTTALRDLICTLSNRGNRVGVIDERGELSGGVFDLGRCSDVISGLDTLSGALLLLRSMNPQVIAADEISSPNDLQAMGEIFGCGVGILASAHACGREDLMKRPAYRRLIENAVFTRLLVIRQQRGKRSFTLEEIA